LDKLINELATVTEQLGETGELNGKVTKLEEKINNLQKEVTNLIGYLSSTPKETWPASAKEQTVQPQITTTPSATIALAARATVVQGRPSVTLRCKQWEDFQTLAVNAQTLSFSYKEDEKVFQADALKGNLIIKYTGALPNFSMILKTWLSRRLEITELNILEGFLDKPK
jgi:hypothetical protein